jgi:hypothetical protein
LKTQPKAKLTLVVMIVLALAVVPHVSANPATNIKVWPVGTVESEEPVVTTSNPTEMMIYVTAYEQRISSAWVLLVLNTETYNGLDHIDVAGVNYIPDDFRVATENKLPLEAADSEFPGYPGCENYLTYSVGAVADKVGGGDVYYAVKKVFDYEISTTPVYFTITHYGTSTNLRILVLALGRETETGSGKFNNHSSFSGSTLIVPELATILLATASLSVFGLYKLKRKKENYPSLSENTETVRDKTYTLFLSSSRSK